MTETKSSKLATFKIVSRIVVNVCVSGTVISIIHQNTATATTSQKVQLYVGAAVIGSMVASAARTHVDNTIDELVELWNKSEESKTPIITDL